MDASPYFWLQPLVTGVAASLVLAGTAFTLRQRYRADRRDQWWGRTRWALDLLVSGDEDRVYLALLVLDQQGVVRVVDAEDTAFITEVVLPITDFYLLDLDAGADDGHDGRESDRSGVAEEQA